MSVTLQIVSDSDTISYADSVNDKFQTSEDTIVSLVDRFTDAFINEDPELPAFLRDQIGTEFRNRHPQYSKFEDMYTDMVQIPMDPKMRLTLGDMLINTVIQRKVDIDWLIAIMGKFDPFFVNSIRVYPIVDGQDGQAAHAIWDGQHTSFVLMCIALYAFGMSVEDALKLEVPTAIHPNHNIAKLRQRFIGVHDNTMTKPLDKIDLFMQYVYAVRHNDDSDPWSIRFAEIQTALEKFGCFFTHEKFSDTKEAGAVSRPSEIFPTGRDVNKWKSSVLSNVFEYHSLSNPDLPIEPLEIDNMAHIFRACDQQGITVDTDYIRQIVKYLGAVTGNTWQKGYTKSHRKHTMVMNGYKSWLTRQHYRVREQFDTRCNQTEVAPTWIIQAIKLAGFKYELPVFIGKFQYDFEDKELGA